jgi:hypothetical protein
MSEFSTKAMLDVQVSESSLRDAQSTIEDRVGSVRTQVATDGGSRRSSGLDGNRLSRENAMSRQLLTKQIEQLDDIHDELQKLATTGGGMGGGGGGGLLTGLTLGRVGGAAAGGLGTLAGLLGPGKGGLFSMATESKGVVRPGSGENVDPGAINKLIGGLVPGVSGKDLTMRDEMAQSMQEDQQGFKLTRPEWLKNPFEGWSNPLQKWSVPESLSLDWSNPLEDWTIPQSLSNGLDWSNPFQDWSMPDWLKNPLGKSGTNKGGPWVSGFRPEKGDFIPGDGPLLQNGQGSRENRAKNQRQSPGAEITVQAPQVQLNPTDLQSLRRDLEQDVVDEVLSEVESQINGVFS